MSDQATVKVPNWVSALVPFALLAFLVTIIFAFNPIDSLREVPPAEALSFERTTFEPGRIEFQVRNDGPETIDISQVIVNDAYWVFDIGEPNLGRLRTTTIGIDYPWEPGLPIHLQVVTATGVVITHDIEVAAETPGFGGETLWIYAVLGLYIGVIPVSIGLLWLPALRRARRGWLAFFLAFTVGLLAFLLVDTTVEGLELATEAAASLDGTILFAIGAIASVLALNRLQDALSKRGGTSPSLVRSYLISSGIGLHNLGEGLAVGAALASGEIALGTFLVVGFALHNTTEGLAIVAPLGSSERPGLKHFVLLAAIAGLPAVIGAWVGGYIFNPAWATLAFGVAAGAIAQVIWAIGKSIRGELNSAVGAGGLVAGLAIMYLTALLIA